MTHKQKLKLARKLMTPEERSKHIPPFVCDGWNRRSEKIKRKVKKQQTAAHIRAIKRKKAKKHNG